MHSNSEPFSANRATHQATIGGEVTGELPAIAYIASRNRYSKEPANFRESLYGWEGCIDAPMILAAGSVRHIAPKLIGVHEWEGAICSRNVSRG